MSDEGTEAEWLSENGDHVSFESDRYRPRYVKPISNYQGGDRKQPKRWRCLATGCNPKLDEASAQAHSTETKHRVAKWPVRSPAGKAKARERQKTGYYDKYNVGAKDALVRGIR